MNITTLSKITVKSVTCCSFHTSICRTVRPERVMRKVMGFSSKKKKTFCESGILPSANMFSKGSLEGIYSGNAKRASVLNKLFMRYITDLMATGEYSSEFLGHGIEINRVQITSDYKGLNVFWVAKGTPDDETVEKLLKKNAGFLRHELSTLRVMGVVPTIYFVKDKQYSQIIEVDCRLAKADFGEDHVPIEFGSKLKTQLELHTPLPTDLRAKIRELDSEDHSDNVDEEEPLPPMPQNVLGLNHAEILNRIKRNLKKSEATHRQCNADPNVAQTFNENPIEFTSNKEQRAIFKDFLEKRELLRTRARKEEKKYVADIEYMREEFLQQRNDNYFRNMDIYEEENDYVTDEDEDNVNKNHK